MKQRGYRFAVNADLSIFFDRVNHDVLLRLLAQRVTDPVLLRLIGKYLRAGVSIDGHIEPTTAGVPQGGPLSPMLANVVLHELDCELEGRGHKFARYADDFVILVKSRRAGERVLRSVGRFLAKHLRLELNEAKSGVVPTEGCEFLGFTFRGQQIRWSHKAEREFKRRVRRLTSRSWGVSMGYRLAKLSQYIRGWIAYFGLSESPEVHPMRWTKRCVVYGVASSCDCVIGRCGAARETEFANCSSWERASGSPFLPDSVAKVLATLPHRQHSHGDDQRLAFRARRHLAEGTLGQHSLPGRQSFQAPPSPLVTA